MLTCAACKKKFEDADNGLFLTCHNCRRPDKTKQSSKKLRFLVKGCNQTEEILRAKYGLKPEEIHDTNYWLNL